MSASQNDQSPSPAIPDIERCTDLCRACLNDPELFAALLEILEQPGAESE